MKRYTMTNIVTGGVVLESCSLVMTGYVTTIET